MVTLKTPKKSPIVRNCSNQEERRRDKTPTHTTDVYRESLMVSVGEPHVVEKAV